MIKYRLACKSIYCKKENDFEAWFQNIESYETQKKSGLITCPSCGGSDVVKLLTAPNLNKLSKQDLGKNVDNISANIPKTNQNFEQKFQDINEQITDLTFHEEKAYGNNPDKDHGNDTVFITVFRKK